MAGRKKTETVEAEVVETAVVPAGKMEFRLINPTEDGFLRRISRTYGKGNREQRDIRTGHNFQCLERNLRYV